MGKPKAPAKNAINGHRLHLPKPPADRNEAELRQYMMQRLDYALVTGRTTTMKEEYARLRARRKPRPDHPERYVAAVRANTSWGKQKRCHCGRVCVSGLDVCQVHGGMPVLRARRLALGILPRPQVLAIGRALRDLYRQNVLPHELTSIPVVAQLIGELHKPYSRKRAAILLHQFVQAWACRQDDDWGPWAAAVTHAREQGYG